MKWIPGPAAAARISSARRPVMIVISCTPHARSVCISRSRTVWAPSFMSGLKSPHPRGSPRRRDQGVKYIILSFIHLSVAKGNLQKFFLFPILPATDQCPEPTRVPDYQNIAPALHPEFIPGCPGAPCTIRKALSLRRSEIVHICPSCRILRWKLFPDFIEGMTIPFPHVNLRQTIYNLNRNTSVNHFLQDRS